MKSHTPHSVVLSLYTVSLIFPILIIYFETKDLLLNPYFVIIEPRSLVLKRISIFELLPHQLRFQREIVVPRRGLDDIPGEVIPFESQFDRAGFSRITRGKFNEDFFSG